MAHAAFGRRARSLIAIGLNLAREGKVSEARAKFRESAFVMPSAEALTCWAWMEHLSGNTRQAIWLCLRSVQIDPGRGHAYNDIGSYLVALQEFTASIPWFQKAIAAERYDTRQYAHINLGRVHFAQGNYLRALQEFKAAEVLDDRSEEIRVAVEIARERVLCDGGA